MQPQRLYFIADDRYADFFDWQSFMFWCKSSTNPQGKMLVFQMSQEHQPQHGKGWRNKKTYFPAAVSKRPDRFGTWRPAMQACTKLLLMAPVSCSPTFVTPLHGCCWETFFIFAYCGLVGNPHLTAKIQIFAPLPTSTKSIPQGWQGVYFGWTTFGSWDG